MPNYKQKIFYNQYRKGVRSFSILLLVFGLAFVIFGFDNIRGAIFIDTNRYATTEGVIVVSQTKEIREPKGKHEYYDIHYEFFVGDLKYASTQINFGRKSGEDIVRLYIKKYPVGQHVTVFYLPSDPTISVLEPDVTDYTKSNFVVACIVLGIAGFGIFWSYTPLIKRKWRARTQHQVPTGARQPRRSPRLPVTQRKGKR